LRSIIQSRFESSITHSIGLVLFYLRISFHFLSSFMHSNSDPHPGNVMVQRRDNRPVLIDWGQCMELDRHQRQRLCEFTLLLRTRCLPLIGAALQTQGEEGKKKRGR